MIKYEDHCCGCATDAYPCKGSTCSLRNVAVYYCDICHEEIIGNIFDVDDKEVCEDCLKDLFRR